MSDAPGKWLAPNEAELRRFVDAGTRRYFHDRRARIGPFVDRHFGVFGSLSIHRHAFGWDLLKAPANVMLAVPNLVLKLGALAAKGLGREALAQRLGRQDLLFDTAVAREIQWLIVTELLELPHQEGTREHRGDALAATILGEPQLAAAMSEALTSIGERSTDPAFRRRLEETMVTYAGTRAAAAEITTALVTLGAGALVMKQATPGMMSLGPAIAAVLAQQSAVAAFPLGAGIGSLWYGVFPVAASPALITGITGGLMGIAAIGAAFAGIIADPVQRGLGLHQRRLRQLVDALEHEIRFGKGELVVRDHYVARLLDLCDILNGALRVARG